MHISILIISVLCRAGTAFFFNVPSPPACGQTSCSPNVQSSQQQSSQGCGHISKCAPTVQSSQQYVQHGQRSSQYGQAFSQYHQPFPSFNQPAQQYVLPPPRPQYAASLPAYPLPPPSYPVQPPPRVVPPPRYAVPPPTYATRPPPPPPKCYVNHYGYKCCSRRLEAFMTQLMNQPDNKRKWKNCNLQKQASDMGTSVEQEFDHSFESIIGQSDFEQKGRFKGDLMCKTKSPDGKVVLMYAPPVQYTIGPGEHRPLTEQEIAAKGWTAEQNEIEEI